MMKVATLTIAAILQLSGVVSTSAAATADNVDIVKRLRSSEQKHKSDEQQQQQRYLSAVDTTCLFCFDGMPNPDLVLPTPGGETCEQAQKYAHTLSVDDAMCATTLAAEALCCPTVTEPTMSMSMSMSHSMSMSVSVPSCAPIYEIGKSDPNFSTLMSLIDLAQLAVVLQGPASFTVVAPPNSAFEALPAETVAFLTAPENLEALQGVLLYHVFTPAATSSEITTGEYESAMGATVSVTNADGAITVNDATVIAADIMACNGIIHVIDKVLIPPTPAPEPEMSMSMSHSMSVSTDTKCHFCMDGMPDPDLVLPTPDGETCQQASDYAHTLTVDDAMCPTVLAAEALCCPAGVTEPTTLPAPVPGNTVECSCTPTEYTFVVDASTDCTFDTVKGNPGIGSTFCFLGSTPVTRQVVEITSVQFVEFDTSGKLIVINQDDTYAEVSEAHGATFTFKSISSELDAAVALNDQLDMVPGGIQITVDAKIDGVIYNNRVAWNYSNKCGKYPIADTEGVGWVALHHHVQAAPAFCPSGVVTSAPVATPVTTDAPVAGTVTTEAPVAGEVHTTDAPVAGEVHTTDAPAVHHGKAGKVAKSAKAKGSKDGGSMRLLMDAYANDELMDALANL